MRRPRSSEALGRGFDHRAEIVTPPGALLLEVQGNVPQLFVANGLLQQRLIGPRALPGRAAKRSLRGVDGKQAVVSQPA